MGNAIRREEAICKEFMWFVLVLFLHLGPSSSRTENEIFLLFIQFGLDRKITIALTWDILLVFIWPWWIHILPLATGAKINDLQWTGCVGYWWMSDLPLPMQPRPGNLVLKNTCLMQSELTGLSLHFDTSKMACPGCRKIAHLCLCVSAANSWWLWFFSTSLSVLCSFQVLSCTQEFPNPFPGLRLSHSLRARSCSSFLIVTIDLGKSINVAFFQFVCLSLASGSFFSSVGSITFLSLDAVWHALLEHRSRAAAVTVQIRRAPPVQDLVTRRASSRHFGEHCRNA